MDPCVILNRLFINNNDVTRVKTRALINSSGRLANDVISNGQFSIIQRRLTINYHRIVGLLRVINTSRVSAIITNAGPFSIYLVCHRTNGVRATRRVINVVNVIISQRFRLNGH